MTEKKPSAGKGANASFCVPKAAIKALLDAKADAVMVGAYLTLACFTDVTGMYSSASVTAISHAMGLNKDRARKAIERLARVTVKIGKEKPIPLVISREAWTERGGETLPDGPVPRSRILHVLHHMWEELGDRVWFSNGLVQGIGTFTRPLKRIKDAGDEASRLFLMMQQAVDVTGWLAVPPKDGPWQHYETVLDKVVGPARLIHGQAAGEIMKTATVSPDTDTAFAALTALIGSGLFYEVVMVLNRNPIKTRFGKKADGSPGDEYGAVPDDAEPLYELDARSWHGYKPAGEEGLAWLTAKTAGALDLSVASGEMLDVYQNRIETGFEPGQFMHKYAAIVARGQPVMIVGVYRPRFRVANPKNAGVKDAWIRIHENRRDGLQFIEQLRKAKGLDPLTDKERQPYRVSPGTPSEVLH